MNWEFTTAQRIRTGAALAVVFLLIMATNVIDSQHFTIVQNSLTSVYEDRLLAKNYLYKISRQMQIKREILQDMAPDEEAIAVNRTANDSIRVLIDKYASTNPSGRASRLFESLQKDLTSLLSYEEDLGESINAELPSLSTTDHYYAAIFKDLDDLSEIQVGEGKREVDFSNRSIDNSNFIAKLEIGALILIGVVLQVLIFVRPLK